MWRKPASSSSSVGSSTSLSAAETVGATSSAAAAAGITGVPPTTPPLYYSPLSTSYPPYQHHSGTTVWSLLFSGVGLGHGGWSWLTAALELMLCYFTYVHPIYVGAAICRRAGIIAGDLAATVSSPNSPTLVTPREVSNCVIAFALLWVLEMLDHLFLRDFIAMRNVYLFARILFCTYLFHPKFHGALVLYERFGLGALVDTYGGSVDDFLTSNMSFLKNNGVVEFALKVLRFGTGWSKEILYVITQLLLPSSSSPSSSPTDALASPRSPSKLLHTSSAAAILAGAKSVTGSRSGGSTIGRGIPNNNNVYYGLNDDAEEVLGVPSATAADLSTSAAMKVAVGSRAATPLRGRRGHEDAHSGKVLKTTPSKSKKKTHEEEKEEEGAKDKKEKREKKEKKEKKATATSSVDTTPERKKREKQKEIDGGKTADQQLRVPNLHVGTDLLLSKGGGEQPSVTPRTAFNSLVSAIDARGAGSPSKTSTTTSPSATTKASNQHHHDQHEYDLLMDDEDLNDLIEGIASKNHIRKERLSVTAVSSSHHRDPHTDNQQPSVPPPQTGTLRDGQRPSDSVNAAAARTLKLFSSRTLTSPSPTDAAATARTTTETVSQSTLRAELVESAKVAKGLSEAMFEDLEVSLL